MKEVREKVEGKPTVNALCDLFGVKRSTYYRWKKKWENASPETEERSPLEKAVQELCTVNKFRYGYRTIRDLLIQGGWKVNRKTVQRIMQEYGWNCRVKVKKRKRTGQPHYIAPNLLERDFTAMAPLRKLVTDITYLPYGNKMLYLSSIKDLFNGEVIAHTIADHQDVSLVLDTLNQLPLELEDVTLHSDQGSVYTSYAYQHAVQQKGITMSMSRKGTPADNASIESFHSSLKSETFYLDGQIPKNLPTPIVIQTVEDYIQYYNEERVQAKLNYRSPVAYRKSVA